MCGSMGRLPRQNCRVKMESLTPVSNMRTKMSGFLKGNCCHQTTECLSPDSTCEPYVKSLARVDGASMGFSFMVDRNPRKFLRKIE